MKSGARPTFCRRRSARRRGFVSGLDSVGGTKARGHGAAVRYGIMLQLLGALLGLAAWALSLFGFGALAVFVGYLGVTEFLMGVAYSMGWPAILGKRGDGSGRRFWGYVFGGPYMIFMTMLRWVLFRVLDEPHFDEVHPGLYVGRIGNASKLPKDTAVVVDLTAEFIVPADVREGYRYHCLPTLDGTAPEPEAMAKLVDTLANEEAPIYVHCAAGHGRSATVAAALLLRREVCATVEEAVTLMQKSRPRVHLGSGQRAVARRFEAKR